jgi:hypothetical protein
MSGIPEQMSTPAWGADTAISMPLTIDADPGQKVEFGGLAFLASGLVHDLTEVDREELLGTGYGPPGNADG